MIKYSFKTCWLDDKEKFQAQLLRGGKLIESKQFDFQSDMFEYIADTMCDLQIAGEDWTISC